MQKIPTLFVRDPDNLASILRTVNPLCTWVTDGEGKATRKWDGTCVRLDEEKRWWARREVKPGKTPPAGFEAADHDPVTGKTVGWEPIEQSPFAKFFAEANAGNDDEDGRPGTYELLGPKINGNPDGFEDHLLMPHGWAPLSERTDIEAAPRDFDGLRDWLAARPYEGIVFHHPDGRMAKIKAKDFR